ncbi:quinon protein alcohol dehydrogenase-like superfamily [Fusarium oxysporum f. sp. albedinis]|nr:quinon protein alcohol dehydrogenase-like superfamily [Fusarium oxysporum f. sp. albedinis]
MCLGSFQFWRRSRKKLNRSSEDPETSHQVEVVPIVGSTSDAQTGRPTPTIDTHLPTTTGGGGTSTVAFNANIHAPTTPSPQSSRNESQPPKLKLQEELWNQAYDKLRFEQPELVGKYEELLSSKIIAIEGIPSEETQNITETSTQAKWDQMRKIAKAELNRTQRSADVKERIDNAIDIAIPIKKMVDQIMPVVPHAQVPWLVVSLTFEIFSSPFKEPGINRTGLLYVMSRIEWYMNLADHLVDDGGPKLQENLHSQLKEHTVELYEKLLLYQIKSICCFNKHSMDRFFRNTLKINDWSGQIDDIKAAETVSSDAQHSLKTLQDMLSEFQRQAQERLEMSDEEDNKACRKHLFKTNPTDDKKRILGVKGALIRESYSWVVHHPQFLDWQKNAQHRRLWIRGDAGKGKTMILCGIIEELQTDPFCRLCYFFCQATDEHLRDAKNVLRGLLFHLIKQYPWLISHVRKDYDNSGEKLFEDHNAWVALCRIFKTVLDDERLREVIIVIDAIDESVNHFIERRVEDLAKHPPYNDDPDICGEITEHLTKNAEGTFLWVALVCKELSSNDVDRRSHVRAILNNSPPGLDKLYDRMLVSIWESRDFALCAEILAATSIAKRHVTLEELLCIVDPAIGSDIKLTELEQVIVSCGSFLYLQKGVVKFIHQSAVDFLLSEDTSSKLPSIVDRHHSLFRNALCVLQTSPSLKRNIYDLEAPDMTQNEINSNKPRPDPLSSLAYLCIYCVNHLYDSVLPQEPIQTLSTIPSEDISAIATFLKSKFLFWIEALSLLGQVPYGVQAIQKLQRLLSQFGSEAPRWIRIAPGLDSNWDACLQTLDEHQDEVYALAYSSDGQWLVSGSGGGVVKLWHAESGACICTLGGHGLGYEEYSRELEPAGVKSVAFSADGESFVSGAWNGIVKVWHRATGNLSSEYQAHQSHATAMAISSDGCTFAYVLPEGFIRIWSIKTEIPSHSFPCPEENVYSVALSADGEWLVATIPHGSQGSMTWNTLNKEQAVIPTGYGVFSAVWSTDAEWVATGGRDGIVEIWERKTRQWIRKIGFQSKFSSADIIEHLAFSTDGNFLAGGRRFTISVWNTETGTLIWGMDSCTGDLNTILFSPDTLRLISGSWPQTIKVWDLSKAAESRSYRSSEYPRQLCSSDGNHFAAYYPGTDEIKVWGKESVPPESILVKDVSTIALSPDNQQVASGSSTGTTITIWDIKTGKVVRQFGGHTEQTLPTQKTQKVMNECQQSDSEISKISFSQPRKGYGDPPIETLVFGNNCQLASSVSGLVKVWDVSKGNCVQSLDDGDSHIRLMTFSKDGKWLAYLSSYFQKDNAMIKLWDIASRQCMSVSSADPISLGTNTLSFSADSQQLAASTCTGSPFGGTLATIFVWDVITGNILRKFKSDKVGKIRACFDSSLERRLHTEHGFFGDLQETKALGRIERMPPFCGYGLSYDMEWIMLNGKRLLWIPEDYRFPDGANDELRPFVDGSRVIWLRGTQSPVRMYFNT